MRSIRNVFWSLGGLGARTLIQVIYFVLLARVLGPKEYGALSSSLAIIYIFVPYATWGAGDTLVKNASRDRSKFSEYWGSALLSILIFGSFFLLFSLLLYQSLLSDKVDIFPVILLGVSELYFLRIIDVSMQAFQAFDLLSRTAFIQFLFSIIRLSFTLLFVFFFSIHTINSWAVLYLSSTVISAIFCLGLVRYELGKAHFGLRLIKDNLLEGFFFSLSPSSQGIYNDFDKSILPKYTTLAITGNYSAAYRIVDALCVPTKALLQTFYAKLFITGKDGINSSKKFAQKLFPIFFFYSVLAVMFLLIFAKIIPDLFGSSYKGIEDIIRLLSPIIIFRAVHSLGADTLTGAGMQGKRSGAHLLMALLNAVLCLTLIPWKGWLGAAWASLITDGVLALLIWGMIFFTSSRSSTQLNKQLE
jgi:O-antigen/teichoic acid export membrane protein